MTDVGATNSGARAGRRAWPAALLPWRLFFGPMFQKEMRVSGRKLGTYFIRAGYALVLAVVVAIAFFGAWESTAYTDSAAARLQSLQSLAPVVIISVLWFQFIATLLLAPVMTGGSICDERRAQTLPTLLTTPLTAIEIVCSKIASRLTHLVILALLAMPILLGVRLFGGVRAETIVGGASLTIASAILAASIGVLASTLCRRSMIASLLTYVILAAIFLAPPLLAMRYNVLINDNFDSGARLPDVLGAWAPDLPATIPGGVIFASSTPGALGAVTMEAGAPDAIRTLWVASSVYTLVLALLATVLAAASLRRAMVRSADTPIPKRRRKRKKTREGEPPEAEPVVLRHRRSRTVPDIPVLWRELRQPLFNRKRTLALAVVVVLIIAGLLYPNNMSDAGVLGVPLALGMILLVLQAALLSAPGLAAEREARTLDTLLTTRLSPWQIIVGKTLGAVRRAWFIPAVLLLHTLVFVSFGRAHWLILFVFPLVMLGPVALMAGTGTLLGQRFRKPITASAVNLAIALALWLAIPILIAVLFEGLELVPHDISDFAGSVLLMTHPVGLCVVLVDALHNEAGTSILDLEVDMPSGDVSMPGFIALLMLSAGFQVAVGLAAVLIARARFVRDTGRSS